MCCLNRGDCTQQRKVNFVLADHFVCILARKWQRICIEKREGKQNIFIYIYIYGRGVSWVINYKLYHLKIYKKVKLYIIS